MLRMVPLPGNCRGGYGPNIAAVKRCATHSAMGATTILALLAGYLLGSIPFGLLLTRLAGKGDIREIGSGNIGNTGKKRLIGWISICKCYKARWRPRMSRHLSRKPLEIDSQ